MGFFFSLQKEINLHVSLLKSEIGGCQRKSLLLYGRAVFYGKTLLNYDVRLASIITSLCINIVIQTQRSHGVQRLSAYLKSTTVEIKKCFNVNQNIG